jgi:putative ABC transport system substrate-binding protein
MLTLFEKVWRRPASFEGRNVRIEERWARGDYGALPALAAELVAMGVVAIAATGDVASARAAQLASNAVPVVFTIGGDRVRHGLVESINRPGRHVTGILFNPNVLGAKRVELLREIAPDVSRIALLMNPTNPNFKIEEADAEAGAKKLGLETGHAHCPKRKRNGNYATAVAECQGPSIDYRK